MEKEYHERVKKQSPGKPPYLSWQYCLCFAKLDYLAKIIDINPDYLSKPI
jgi:hypothetical protein